MNGNKKLKNWANEIIKGKGKTWRKFIMASAMIVCFVTTYMLILPAISIDGQTAREQGGIDVSSTKTVNSMTASSDEGAAKQDSKQGAAKQDKDSNGSDSSSAKSGHDSDLSDGKGSLGGASTGDAKGNEDGANASESTSDSASGSMSDGEAKAAAKDEDEAEDENAAKGEDEAEGEDAAGDEDEAAAGDEDEAAAGDEDDAAAGDEDEAATGDEDEDAAEEEDKDADAVTLEAEGDTYKVIVSYDQKADIPEGAKLKVSEILQEKKAVDGATEYEEYIAKTQEALGVETAVFEYARLFDIKIVDKDGEKVKIAAPVDVRIELTDKDAGDGAVADAQVIHFADGADKGDIVNDVKVVDDVTADGQEVSFEAEGFSAYAIVAGPEATDVMWHKVSSIEELASMGSEGLYIGHTTGYYFTGKVERINNTSRTGIVKTKPAQSQPASAAVKYYFEQAGASNKFKVYCLDGESKKYIRQSGNSLNLTTDANSASVFTIEPGTNENEFRAQGSGGYYWNMQGGESGETFAAYNLASDKNAQLYFWHREEVESDPYDLDGTSYGLMNWNEGPAGKGMMASSSDGKLDAKTLTVMSKSNNTNTIFVPNDSDISMWTFHWIDDDNYYLTAVVGGSTKYLRIDTDGLSLVSEPDENCKIQVIPGAGTHAGKICLKSCGNTLTYSGSVEGGFSVNGSAGAEWLNFVELSELTPEHLMTYSARKVSVSDEAVTDGSKVIVYTRSWNDETKSYDYYAIDSDGTLVPVYESGDSIEWKSGQINTLLWNFTEYYWEGTEDPTFYYELYNQYSKKYIAPQIEDGQVLSSEAIGINMNGRRDGQYYSTIMAWDTANYAYAGLKVEDGRIVSCPKSESMDFFFAIMEDQNVDDVLHTVKTVDHTQYGITMKMIDLENGNNHNGYMSQFLGNSEGGMGTVLHQGLLSTDLGDDGYPSTMQRTGDQKSLSEMYSGSRVVNNLFIDSIYRSTGYFEFDSTQNFASLQSDNNFKVYKELGTYDISSRPTLKHGQFFPFNDLAPGVFASANGKNLYSFSDPLPDSDPRKYESLYSLENNNKKVDPYFAMELEASFTQTPNGMDAWNHDIIFEFTGDDDFWLYVDGELVIDLGGIHSAVPGSVNFRTGEVYVNGTHTTLRQLFYNNYLSRNHTAEEAEAYVNGLFEERVIDGQTHYVFKDFTNHTMRIFYMERGAGASNLQMRFNLAAVKKGNVQLSKNLSGVDEPESVMAEYPYQIFYKKSEEEGAEEFRLKPETIPGTSRKINYVYFKDSVKPVKYQESVSVGGAEYEDVYFLKPGQTADISFPEGMTSYRIVECGVNTDVYSKVEVNDEEITGTDPAGSGDSKYKDFGIDYATTDERAKVDYVNTVAQDALRDLTITKKLYDESGQNEISYDQDQTFFNFRLYMTSEYDELDDQDLVNMHAYHVKDPDGYYCKWNASQQKFEKIGEGITNYSDLSDAEKESATFYTSVYGQISNIGSGYTVEVRNVLAGTQFKAQERQTEIPDGYSFQRYEYNGSDYIDPQTNESAEAEAGVSDKVDFSKDPEVTIRNLKGWGLRVNKEWSDADYMSDREATYFAVYLRKNNHGSEHGHGYGLYDYVEGTLMQMPYASDPQTLYWYFQRLESGTDFTHYEIREVRIDSGVPQVNSEGVVTNANSLRFTMIRDKDGAGKPETISLDGKQKGETDSSEFEYSVLYGDVTQIDNVRVQPVTNNRPGIILKKSKWDGTTPLEGASFTLKDDAGNIIGNFTSDENGAITTAFLRDDVQYTLEETRTPQGWQGLQEPLKITLNNKEISASGADDSWYVVDNDTATPTLTIKDRPYTFKAFKKDGDTDSPIAGVGFELHKQVTVDNVTTIDPNPMPGYESLVTGSDGVIPKIDNTLPPGIYELREATTPAGFEPLSGYIHFKVSETGAISLIGTEQEPIPEGVTLTDSSETGTGSDGTVAFVLAVSNFKKADVKLQKVDDKGEALNGATFKLCEYNSESAWEVVDGYGEIDMTEVSNVMFSGLGPGRYRLTETSAPDGYIILSRDVYFNIGFGTSGNVQVTLTDEEGTGANSNSNASVNSTVITVANTPGEALPNSGGCGTKWFYILGSLLIVGCSAVLFARRRSIN